MKARFLAKGVCVLCMTMSTVSLIIDVISSGPRRLGKKIVEYRSIKIEGKFSSESRCKLIAVSCFVKCIKSACLTHVKQAGKTSCRNSTSSSRRNEDLRRRKRSLLAPAPLSTQPRNCNIELSENRLMPTDEKYPNPDAQAVLVEGFELVDGVLRLNRT